MNKKHKRFLRDVKHSSSSPYSSLGNPSTVPRKVKKPFLQTVMSRLISVKLSFNLQLKSCQKNINLTS